MRFYVSDNARNFDKYVHKGVFPNINTGILSSTNVEDQLDNSILSSGRDREGISRFDRWASAFEQLNALTTSREAAETEKAPGKKSIDSSLEDSPPKSSEINRAIVSRCDRWTSALELGNTIEAGIESIDLEKVAIDCGFMPTRYFNSRVRRFKMIYNCRFGEFGVLEGQFTEPSGVAINAQSDIVVADTNNHRIQVFDKEGRFKFQFGECGKRDGQLLYPNRVAVNKETGDYIVTERAPTHQIQVYNQYGQFLRKFGSNILQHPRGVCVDKKGRIVVVECKVMRVIIFDMLGNVLHKFNCANWLEFPNGVCTNDHNEILISDNRAHCVKVFSYDGAYLRHYGGEGITNYPIGVAITSAGEVVVADNHNNFNLTVFSQDGILIGALESKVKHAQCFDVALVDDCSIVLASKDYRLYIYRFSQLSAPSY